MAIETLPPLVPVNAAMQRLSLSLLAQSDTTNRWLRDDSTSLPLIFFALGGFMIAYGTWSLKSGKARGKYGTQLQGTTATVLSVIRILCGIACCGFAIYQLIVG